MSLSYRGYSLCLRYIDTLVAYIDARFTLFDLVY